jgi:hypothetical protein
MSARPWPAAAAAVIPPEVARLGSAPPSSRRHRIAFDFDEHGHYEIETVNLDGGESQRLTCRSLELRRPPAGTREMSRVRRLL